jgi:ParB family chromosome partitioning protein
MSDYKSSLGRGLGSLIPTGGLITPPATSAEETAKISPVVASTVVDSEFQYIATGKIVPNPYQPRQEFKHEELEQLAESIKKYGVLAPLLVVRQADKYQLIAGERRWQAATLIGLERVPAIVREATKLEMLEISLLENLQREDLNPIEEALAYQRFIDEFGLTQEQVAERVDKNRSTIANSLRLLNLPAEIKEAIKLGTVSRSQAKVILGVADPKYQLKLFKKIVREGLTVRQTDQVKSIYKKIPGEGIVGLELSASEERLRNFLNTRVKIEGAANQGKIVIGYYSQEELRRILERIVGQE